MSLKTLPSPLGSLYAEAGSSGLLSLNWSPQRPSAIGDGEPWLIQLRDALDAYWAKDWPSWEQQIQQLSKVPQGSSFRQQIWDGITKIPIAQQITYGQLAQLTGFGAPSARAVGGACAANPLLLVIPCHRVTGAHGDRNFAAGLFRKQWLLKHESEGKSH
ncbi:MAG TPA: methylated-DNA--[protein]-cysteine S-methyltransferase [Fibrobacteraceae bacterium]|nr:methylated-DNA--[protein]-cysteine S-methyltransferase [Fibrobacteraceae bacterium]